MSSSIVAGVDVGGVRKGFHAVALQDGTYIDQATSCNPEKIVSWCREVQARFVAVDAPCHWGNGTGARLAEQQLMEKKIWCFSTPCREAAEVHPTNYYGWMMNGAKLYASLIDHSLYDGKCHTGRISFETFPHAIACALAGKIVPAREKKRVRRQLLESAGIDTTDLKNIDQIDAALCALTAHYFAFRTFKTYGEAETGFIIVPNR
jgi:predicted RNase H-like nuclease